MKQDDIDTPQTEPKSERKPLPPIYVSALALAKELNIPAYRKRQKIYDALEKAGFFWSEDGQAWQKQTTEPAPQEKQADAPHDDSRIIIDKTGILINGKNGWYSVANFGLKLLYQISDQNDNITWQAAILHDDQEIPVELSNDEFATPARFHASLLKKGFVFKGDKYELNLIKERLLPTAKQAENVSVLGHHARSGVFVFGNGIFNEKFTPPNDLGMVEHDKQAFFLPFANKLHLSRYKNAARFVYVDGKTTFDEWATLYAQAHLRQGLFPLLFKIAALFRDIPVNRLHYFPILYLRGPHGTGKSRMAQGLTALDGYPQSIFTLKSENTIKSLPRTLAQVANSVVWFDEWFEGLDQGVKGTLQAVYDGGGYHRAEKTMGIETNSVDILSAVVLTSNYLPTDPIFLSRCCIVNVPDSHKTEPQKAAFDKLNALENAGLSCVTGELLGSRELICKRWSKTYENMYQYLRENCGAKVDTRTMSNMAILLTPAIILEKAGKIHLKQAYQSLYEGFELKEIGRSQAIQQENYLAGTSELNTFFMILSQGVESGHLEPQVDVVVRRNARDKPYIALRLAHVMKYYLIEHRKMMNKVGLSRQEIENLLQAHPAFMENKTVKFGFGGQGVPIKNTLILDYQGIVDAFDIDL